jgi:hypothetical protein
MKMTGLYHAWNRRGMHTGIQQENLKESDHYKNLNVDGRIILK